MAGQIPEEPVIAELRRAHAAGATHVTFLGGEPTIQRNFFPAITAAKELGFEEIILFTNGVQTAREDFIDEVLAIGDFTWRFSIQGGTRQHHDAVTRNSGSFDKLHRGIRHLRAREQRVTANMCVTTENLASLPRYPELIAETGVESLHLDMIRPRDAGDRSDEYLRTIMPRYSDMQAPLREMLEGFDESFEVHVGNFPPCLLPEWAHRIHHDGVSTWTVSADGRNRLDAGWDKYSTKRADKNHPPACEQCVFRPHCNGLFESYQEKFGVEEILPVLPEHLEKYPLRGRAFVNIHGPTIAALTEAPLPPPWSALRVQPDEHAGIIRVIATSESEPSSIALTFAPAITEDLLHKGPGWGLEVPPSLAHAPRPVAALILALLLHLDVRECPSEEALLAVGHRTRSLLPHAARLHAHAERHGRTSRIVATPRGLRVEMNDEALGGFQFTLEPPRENKRTPRVGYSLNADAPGPTHRALVEDVLNVLRGAPSRDAQETA
jgi:MoaA/NifB/PqqE/SkfB family radical SAM enzyme